MIPSLLLLAACTSPPASIEVASPQRITDPAPFSLSARALDSKGAAVEGATVTAVAVSDEGVMRLGSGGQLQCARTGEATVTLQVAEVKQDVVVHCLLVKEIRLERDSLAAVLMKDTEGAIAPIALPMPGFTLVDLGGETLPADLAQVQSTDEAVARLTDAGVELVGPGGAELRVTAGARTAVVRVEAGLEVAREAGLVVADGDEHGVPLPAGRYRAIVESDQPVDVAFRGTDCEQDEVTAARLECTLDKTSTVVVKNPGLLRTGPAARVMLRIVQIPGA